MSEKRHRDDYDADEHRSKRHRSESDSYKKDSSDRKRKRSRSRSKSRERSRSRDRKRRERDEERRQRKAKDKDTKVAPVSPSDKPISDLKPATGPVIPQAVPQTVLSPEEIEEAKRKQKEEEQRQLDAEMQKRRERVEQWRKERMKQQQTQPASENPEPVESPQPKEGGESTKKKWILEGEDDLEGDDEETPSSAQPEVLHSAIEEEEEDAYDAYMNALEKKAQIEVAETERKIEKLGLGQNQSASGPPTVYWGYDEDEKVEEGGFDVHLEDFEELADDGDVLMKKKRKKNLSLLEVDHSKIQYTPFRADFYYESPEIAKIPRDEVMRIRREELDGCVVHGSGCPRPIATWGQCGLSPKMMEVITKVLKFEAPTAIQRQAIPAVMCGRDIIACAKTGSGKTLAYVLPMLRHVMEQPKLKSGDGPIALVMAPTRELITQINSDIKKFTTFLPISTAAVYGGAGIADQIGDLKRGVEIVVCTPGRMIDVLVSNAGRITNLRRVTFLVLDEADRMFDLGFEQQITKIIDCIRPDRQTIMFSATFPFAIEQAARRILRKPLEIICGGRGVACKDVEQHIEVFPDEDAKFKRLLQLVVEWYERGQILIFVKKQKSADKLFQELLGANYPCLVLHGGIDQKDRTSTLSDFKKGEKTLMVATSVAARGLDVKGLELVVNFDVPNHMEDYVHRIGRTGRAGRKGTAFTFLTPEDEKFSQDIVKALNLSEQPIPSDLKTMAEEFERKKQESLKHGKNIAPSKGYGGKGFGYSESEDLKKQERRKLDAIMHDAEDLLSDEENEDEVESDSEAEPTGPALAVPIVMPPGVTPALPAPGVPLPTPPIVPAAPTQASPGGILQSPLVKLPSGIAIIPGAAPGVVPSLPLVPFGKPVSPVAVAPGVKPLTPLPLATKPITPLQTPVLGQPLLPMPPGAGLLPTPGLPLVSNPALEAAQKALQWAYQLNASQVQAEIMQKKAAAALQQQAAKTYFEEELEINDYPQQARWKVTHKDALRQVSESTGAAITTRGTYFPPGKPVPPGERKIYLFIEGSSLEMVGRAKKEIKKVLDEYNAMTNPELLRVGSGRYSVL